MSKKKNPVAEQLLTALAPHLSAEGSEPRPSKSVAKALKQLARQVTKSQPKQAKGAVPTEPTAKQARKSLAGELSTALQPHLTGGDPEAALSNKVSKLVQRLAAELVKQRRKHGKQARKAAANAASVSSAKPAPAAGEPKAAAKAPAKAPAKAAVAPAGKPAARRVPAPKQPVAPAATATPAVENGAE